MVRFTHPTDYPNDGKQVDDALPTIHRLPFEILSDNGALGI